jgi:hypothetical protein
VRQALVTLVTVLAGLFTIAVGVMELLPDEGMSVNADQVATAVAIVGFAGFIVLPAVLGIVVYLAQFGIESRAHIDVPLPRLPEPSQQDSAWIVARPFVWCYLLNLFVMILICVAAHERPLAGAFNPWFAAWTTLEVVGGLAIATTLAWQAHRAARSRRCPACLEWVSARAPKCRYCGSLRADAERLAHSLESTAGSQ